MNINQEMTNADESFFIFFKRKIYYANSLLINIIFVCLLQVLVI